MLEQQAGGGSVRYEINKALAALTNCSVLLPEGKLFFNTVEAPNA